MRTVCVFAGRFHFDRNFAQKFHRRKIVLGKVSPHRLGQLLLFYELNQAKLRRSVPILASRSCAA